MAAAGAWWKSSTRWHSTKAQLEPLLCGKSRLPTFLLKRARQARKVHAAASSGNFLPLPPLEKHNCHKQHPCSLLSEPKPQNTWRAPRRGVPSLAQMQHQALSPEFELTGFIPYQFSVTAPWPLCSFKWQKTLGGCIYILGQTEATLSPSVLLVVENS